MTALLVCCSLSRELDRGMIICYNNPQLRDGEFWKRKETKR